MKNVIQTTSFIFKRTAWIKPPINLTVLIYNSCDGYHMATWSGDDFISSSGSILPLGVAELWHELPTEDNLLNILNEKAFIELEISTLIETQLS